MGFQRRILRRLDFTRHRRWCQVQPERSRRERDRLEREMYAMLDAETDPYTRRILLHDIHAAKFLRLAGN